MSDTIRELYNLIKENISYDEIKKIIGAKLGQKLTNKAMFGKLVTLLENLLCKKGNNFDTFDFDLFEKILNNIDASLAYRDFPTTVIRERFDGLKKKLSKANIESFGLSEDLIIDKLIDIKFSKVGLQNNGVDINEKVIDLFVNCENIDLFIYIHTIKLGFKIMVWI